MSAFPKEENHILIKGPVGQLEGVVSIPKNLPVLPTTVVICHPHPLYGGTMDNKVVQTIFKSCLRLGLKVVKFNFRGVGKSEGSFTGGPGEIEDAEAVIEWVRQNHPEDSIALAGFSFGSYVSTRVAGKGACVFLITVAPPVKYFNFSEGSLPKCPWVVIQGDADVVVPPEDVFKWFESLGSNAKLIRMAGVDHYFHKKLNELQDVLVREMKGILQMVYPSRMENINDHPGS